MEVPSARACLVVFISVTVLSHAVIIAMSLLGANKSVFSLALSSQGLEVGRRETINRCRELKRDHWS